MFCFLAIAALAADPTSDDESISGLKKAPPVPEIPIAGPPAPAAVVAKQRSAERGAKQLGVDVAFVQSIQEGVDKLYRRDYAGAKEHFVRFEAKYPNSGVAAAVDVLVWQAMMLENFDFKYDAQYWVSAKAARAGLDRALTIPGNEAWEHFLYGGMVGVESIHTVRTGSYLPALQLAFEALDHIQECRERAPEFTDLLLADGMYNYWRSVLTMSSKILPDFEDKRPEGLAQMKEVEANGIFLAPAGTLSLTFSYLEEGRYTEALGACQKNRAKYSDNVINNMITGMTYIYMRKYPDAVRLLDEVLKDAPDNRRVHYWKGVALLRSNELPGAEAELKGYLGAAYLEAWQKSATNWRLGQLYQKQQRYVEADAAYSAAVKIDGHSQAKAALESMRDSKKQGKITY